MKRYVLLCTLALLFLPGFTFAKGASTLYSLNGWLLYGGEDAQGAEIDFAGTHYVFQDTIITPVFTLAFGLGGIASGGFQVDLKALGGVGFMLTNFTYFDAQIGAKGILEFGKSATAGVDLIADTNMLLHVGEIIGLRIGCAFLFGHDPFLIAPHVGIATSVSELFDIFF